MIGLLLDSSDKNLSVGLAQDHVLIEQVSYVAWQRQSEFMVDEIDKALKKHGLKGQDINYVVCSKGPGSYTGVRIALTIAKTISFALHVPLYLASSLEVLQDAGKASLCLMNARGKRSYFAVYDGEKALEEDQIKDDVDVISFLKEHPEYSICGDVAYLHLEGHVPAILENLNRCDTPAHLCEEPLGARPIYLKDNYDMGTFKTIVRKMLPSDLSAVMEIEQQVFLSPYTEKQMLYELNENPVSHLYCAVVDNEVVGFIDFMITFDSASICQIGVKEEFRRKGIGNMLLGQMIKDCEAQEEPVEFLTLEVRKSNLTAQAFYKRHKFQQVTVKPHFYSNGEDAYYMIRSLIHA